MDDSWPLRACSSRASSHHFPLPGSRNQIDMNFGQFSHPYVAQEVCVIERTIRQEPVAPSTMNYGYSGGSARMVRPEHGNSFLALLSAPSQQFRSEYQQPSNVRSTVLAGNSPFYQVNALDNGAWPSLTASDVCAVSQTNGGFGSGLEMSHFGGFRESLRSSYNRMSALPDNFNSGIRTSIPDILKPGNRSDVHDSEAELQASVPQWLTDAANLRQQQIQSIQNVRLPKSIVGTGYAEVEQSSSVMKSKPRVFCVGTNGMLSGELVLSDSGRLGVLCSCHNRHMSVAKFSEHAGLASDNPGIGVHMENGESIVMWRKAFFFEFGVKVPDDEKGWDWNDGNSSETGALKCKTASSQNVEKNNISAYQVDHLTAKSKIAHFSNNHVYHNNCYEGHVPQGPTSGGFFPHAAQKNVHEALLKNFSKVCKGGVSAQLNSQPLENVKDNLSKVPDIAYRGSSHYGNASVAEYIDFINNGGQTFISNQTPAGLKNFQKGFTLNNMNNIQEPASQEKDTMSSGFELRLGQPSQQTHAIGGPLPATLDSQVANAALDRQKSLFLERMLQRVYDPILEEAAQQNGTCNLPVFSCIKEKGKERQLDNQRHGVGRTNVVQSGCIDHLKGDTIRGSVVPMPCGHSNGLVDEIPVSYMNKVMRDPEQRNKLVQMNSHSHPIKHDIPESLRNKAIGIPNKGYTRSVGYECHSNETVFGTTTGTNASCDMFGSSLIQAKQRIDNRLFHDIIPGHCLPPDTNMHNRQSLASEIHKATLLPIETDIRNSPNQMAMPSNFGISDHSDSFWLRAINSAISKNSGPALLSAAAQLNISREAAITNLSRTADDSDNRVDGAARYMRMSEEQFKNVLDFMGGIHSDKRSEIMANNSNQESKSDISREQGQLAGLFGNMIIPVQRSCNQDGQRNNKADSNEGMCHQDKRGLSNRFGNADKSKQDLVGTLENSNFLGTSSSRSNVPSSEDQNLKNSQTKEALVKQLVCSLSTANDRQIPSLTRHSQMCLKNLDGELSITKQKESEQGFASENDHPGELESHQSKEGSRTDAHITESKENAISVVLGTNSAVVVSVGENDSGAEKGSAEQNKVFERHDMINTHCESFQSKQENGKAVANTGVMPDESPVDLTNSRGTVEDHLADTAAKGSTKGAIDTGSPKKEEQMSNVCSKISENVFSEFSDAGHVINDINVDCGGKKLMRSDIVDEGSGIGKCCSSDAVDTGVWTKKKNVSIGGDKKMVISPSLLPNPTSTDCNGVSRVRSSLRLKNVHKSTTFNAAESEQASKTVCRTSKPEKKRRTMKWKRLDATGSDFKVNDKISVHLGHAMKTDSSFIPSGMAGKSSETQCATASVSSTPTKVSSLKRKRSSLLSGNLLASNHKKQEFQEDKAKDEPVQQVQFKGDKLVIRIRQASAERKMKQQSMGRIDCDFDKSTSRKVTKCDAVGFGKTLSLRNDGFMLPEDKTKLTQSGSSSARKTNVRTGNGKPMIKTAKMASLSSILKHAKNHLDTPCKGGKQSASRLTSSALGKSAQLAKFSEVQRKQANELKGSFECTIEPDRQSNAKESFSFVNVKEVRKRSLWELTGKNKHEDKSSNLSLAATQAQSKNACQVDLSNALGGEFSTNHCTFPRGERTLRLRFKCPQKSNFRKPISTSSVDTSHWLSESHHTVQNILFQSNGVRKSKLCMPVIGVKSVFMPVAKDDHNASKCQISSIQEPFNSSTKKTTKTGLTSVALETKEIKYISKSTSRVFKKQKQANDAKKVPDYLGECMEMPKVSMGPKSVKVVKTKKRSNNGDYGQNHGSDSLPKRCKMENAAFGSTSEVDMRCCVCGDLNEQSFNRLVQCGCCLIKVHQACYGVSKVPKSSWTCRACKSNLSNIVCVLCGYGGGAMTRAQKTRTVVKSLLQVWQVTRDCTSKTSLGNLGSFSTKCSVLNEVRAKPIPEVLENSKAELDASGNSMPNILMGKGDSTEIFFRSNIEDAVLMGSTQMGKAQNCLNSEFLVHNTITAAVNDPSVTQWVHMVCGLWMPGTRCLNNVTMGVFDVSGAVIPKRKVVCSICNRPGGLCIQCRVVKCTTLFHPWCARQKSLLQSEIEGDHGDKVGFYGKCMLHAKDGANHNDKVESRDKMHLSPLSRSDEGTCARTEGYKGRKRWEESRAELRRNSYADSTRVVSQEQINAWLHINGRKSCTRDLMKPPNTDIKTDYRREYLRFKQQQRWKRLVVYKSGIHALGLYTAQSISKGEMVVEYVGEVVGLRVADKREADYLKSGGKMQYEGACYFFRIDKESIIDATRKGGIARFVNHSCSPNCVAKVISFRSQKKVVFFAERDINAGEEITYDYHFNHEDDGKKIPCFCNSRNCRRYLN